MSEEIKVDSEEYKERFIAIFVKAGLSRENGIDEHEANMPMTKELGEFSNPESDANEALSYWAE